MVGSVPEYPSIWLNDGRYKKETPPNKRGRRANDTIVGVVKRIIHEYIMFVKIKLRIEKENAKKILNVWPMSNFMSHIKQKETH